MMDHLDKLCMSCLVKKDSDGVCPVCKTTGGIANPKPYLPGGSMLGGRYLTGRLIDFNGEGATYLGLDTLHDKKVLIREYLPEGACTRAGQDLQSEGGHDAKYKALMSDFVDLSKMVRRMDHIECLVKILDIFPENNTAYAIYEAIDGIRLDRFLRRTQASKIPYAQLIPLFLPLLYALREMHEIGFLHRGISLRTLYIDRTTGSLKLFGYGIAAARTASSEMTPELFNGFAAPEQYDPSLWQGTWTDVYAVAGVMYTLLTGVRPENAMNRLSSDNVSPQALTASGVPEEAAKAIVKALELPQERRTTTVEPLVQGLARFEGAVGVYGEGEEQLVDSSVHAGATLRREIAPMREAPESQQRPRAREGARRRKPKRRYMSGCMIWFITTLFSLAILGSVVVMLVTAFLNAQENMPNLQAGTSASSSSDYVGEGETIDVPDFTSREIDEVLSNPDYLGVFVFDTEEKEDPLYPEGVIISQVPDFNEKVPVGSTIKLYVSKGAEKVPLPSLTGLSLSDAVAQLNELGILYETMKVYDDTVATDIIVRTSPDAGTEVTPNSIVGKIILFVSAGRSPDSPQSSEEPSGGFNW